MNSSRSLALVNAMLAVFATLPAQNAWFYPGPSGSGISTPAGFSHFSPTVSADELYLVFASDRAGQGDYDLYEASRATVDDPWTNIQQLAALSSGGDDYEPHLTITGRALFFVSTRAGAIGVSDIYVSRRPNTSAPWGAPTNLGAPVNAAGVRNDDPYLSENRRQLFFASDRSGGMDIWRAVRPALNVPFGAPTPFAPANSTSDDHSPLVEGNGDVVWFSSTRPGGSSGSADFWMITRDPVTNQFSAPVTIPDMNTPGWDSNASRGRTTGNIYLSHWVSAIATIPVICSSSPPIVCPDDPSIGMQASTISSPPRMVFLRTAEASVASDPTKKIIKSRWLQASPTGRLDVMAVSLSLLSVPIQAGALITGAEGALFIGSPIVVSVTVVPPNTVMSLESYTQSIPTNPAFIGLPLYFQGVDLDTGGTTVFSQPLLLTLV